MTPSIIYPGKFLPDNKEEFETLGAQNKLRYLRCIECDGIFSHDNVYTKYGWRETQISGMCENCYDKLTDEG